MGCGVELKLCVGCKHWDNTGKYWSNSKDAPCQYCLFELDKPMWESKEHVIIKAGTSLVDASGFDIVDKPQHYADKNIEVIDYMEDTLSKEGFEGYCSGNVIKYISRYRHKNGIEDLKKSRYYLNKLIEHLEK